MQNSLVFTHPQKKERNLWALKHEKITEPWICQSENAWNFIYVMKGKNWISEFIMTSVQLHSTFGSCIRVETFAFFFNYALSIQVQGQNDVERKARKKGHDDTNSKNHAWFHSRKNSDFFPHSPFSSDSFWPNLKAN